MRVLVIGAALGATFLGNTYQSANLVSNILFELLAAGILSSVLVPSFVVHLSGGDRDAASRLASATLGALLVVLTPIVLLAMLGGNWIMRLLTIALENPATREQQIALGRFLLWFFLPQVLLYAIGAVSTGLLHADRRFSAPAAAPVLNNIFVIATMVLFWVMRDGTPGLDLTLSQRLVLAMGTTLGVMAMSALPLVATRRAGFSLWPRRHSHRGELAKMARRGAWAAGQLAMTQVLLGVTLILANRVEGGAVAYQIAFTFFLLPFALVTNPILTTLFPLLSQDAHESNHQSYAAHLNTGITQLITWIMPASVLLIALAQPLLGLMAYGELASHVTLVAHTLSGYAVGLVGYSVFQLLTRAMYADDDTRTPTLVSVAMTIGGTVLMIWWSGSSHGDDSVASLGLAHSVVQSLGALALYGVVSTRRSGSLKIAAPAIRVLLASLCAGIGAWFITSTFELQGRTGSAIILAVASSIGLTIYAGILFALGSPELRRPSRQEADI